MRRLLLLLVPALLCIGTLILSRIAPDWHFVQTGESGSLLYVAAFDGFLEDWDVYDDGQLAAQIDSAAMRLSIKPTESMPFSLTKQSFADFDLTLDARAMDGTLDNAYGVMFRVQPARRYGSSWGDYVVSQLDQRLLGPAVERSHYRFMVSSDGYYSVWREVNGVEKVLSAWIDSPLVNEGFDAPNRLRVVAKGAEFEFYINDEPVPLCIPNDPNGVSTYTATGECFEGQMMDKLIDDSIANGRLGVVAQSLLSEGGVVVSYDNLVVYAP